MNKRYTEQEIFTRNDLNRKIDFYNKLLKSIEIGIEKIDFKTKAYEVLENYGYYEKKRIDLSLTYDFHDKDLIDRWLPKFKELIQEKIQELINWRNNLGV